MKNLLIIASIISCGFNAISQEFEIIAHSDNSITTHKLSSGDEGFQIGITSNGGGVINFVNLPGKGDIMRLASDRYGRAGQLAFRDSSHGGSYNPTQAGYNEELGTKCQVVRDNKKLIVPQRGMALWFGDNRYDFTHWENIGDDSKDSDGGNSDKDGIDESNLPGKQATEVFSEFDYYGIYEDVFGQNNIEVATIRHYFEASFIRKPGHCIDQFKEGTPMYNANALRREIKNLAPKGSFPGTEKDLNGVIAVWTLRNDVARWDYKFIYLRNASGNWVSLDATKNVPASYDQSVIIMAESDNPKNGRALGLYKPNSEINKFPIVGINENTGTIDYKDNRIRLASEGTKLSYSKFRAPSMSKYGFSNRFSGMINRTRLQDNQYEMYRGEYFISYGTPQRIMDNIDKITKLKKGQNISLSKLGAKKVGDADFFPKGFSDSRLPLTYTSSNTNVAKIENGKIVITGPGSTTITANQEGNNIYLKAKPTSQELVVTGDVPNKDPEIEITSPEDGAIFLLGDEIPLTANASDPEGKLDKVNFKIDGNFYKTDSRRPFANTFTPTKAGTYVIGARAFDKDGLSFEKTVTVTVETTLSSESFLNPSSLDNIKVYPSPASSVLHITGLKKQPTGMSIIDLSGKVIMDINQTKNNPSIDITNLAKGFYFLKIYSQSKQKTISFIKK